MNIVRTNYYFGRARVLAIVITQYMLRVGKGPDDGGGQTLARARILQLTLIRNLLTRSLRTRVWWFACV